MFETLSPVDGTCVVDLTVVDGKGTTSFAFPSYTPAAKGTITWTATIADVDPDDDTTTATTVVK